MGTLVLMLSFMYLLGHAGATQNINKNINVDCNNNAAINLSKQEVTVLTLNTGSDNVCTFAVMAPEVAYFYTYEVDIPPGSSSSVVLNYVPITTNQETSIPQLGVAPTIDIDTRSDSSFVIRLYPPGSENVPLANTEVGLCPGTAWTTPGYPYTTANNPFPTVFEYTFATDDSKENELKVSFFFQSLCMGAMVEIFDDTASLVGSIPSIPAIAESAFIVTGTHVTVKITINEAFCDFRGAEFRVCYAKLEEPPSLEPGAVCNEDAQCGDNASCCSKERYRALRSIRKLKKKIERLENKIQNGTQNDKQREKLENKLQKSTNDLQELESSLPNGRCVCDKGYFSKDGECKVKLDGDCVNNDDCGIENSECDEEKCKCKDGFKARCGECKPAPPG